MVGVTDGPPGVTVALGVDVTTGVEVTLGVVVGVAILVGVGVGGLGVPVTATGLSVKVIGVLVNGKATSPLYCSATCISVSLNESVAVCP